MAQRDGKGRNHKNKGRKHKNKGRKPENDDFTNPDIHYVEVKERVAYRALYNRFKTMADKAKRKTGRKLVGITKAWPLRCMA